MPLSFLLFEDALCDMHGVGQGGISTADRIVTVSPGYAWEIQTPEGGWGMEQMLGSRAYALNGVLNGIDNHDWNPQHDKHLVHKYSVSNFSRGKVGVPSVGAKFSDDSPRCCEGAISLVRSHMFHCLAAGCKQSCTAEGAVFARAPRGELTLAQHDLPSGCCSLLVLLSV